MTSIHAAILTVSNSKHILKKYPRRSESMPRGGYAEHIGYDNTDIHAEHFHYVTTPSPFNRTLPFYLDKAFRDLTDYAAYTANVHCVNMEDAEITIRVLWYPSQPRVQNLGVHKDFCYLTIPIWDSEKPSLVGAGVRPHHGELAEHYEDSRGRTHEGFLHSFKCPFTRPRTYIVAFIQQDLDMVNQEGVRYGDKLSQLANAQNTEEEVKY